MTDDDTRAILAALALLQARMDRLIELFEAHVTMVHPIPNGRPSVDPQ